MEHIGQATMLLIKKRSKDRFLQFYLQAFLACFLEEQTSLAIKVFQLKTFTFKCTNWVSFIHSLEHIAQLTT